MLVRLACRAGGFLVLAIGIAHFFMPEFGYAPAATENMSGMQIDHFVNLATYAIGSFLISFGLLTLMINPHAASRFERVFLALMAVVWGLRIALEIIYPVHFRLFFLNDPHPALILSISVIWFFYIISLIGSLGAKSQIGID